MLLKYIVFLVVCLAPIKVLTVGILTTAIASGIGGVDVLIKNFLLGCFTTLSCFYRNLYPYWGAYLG